MLTADEWKVLGYLVAGGLTLGGLLVVVLFAAACAINGLNDSEPQLDAIQREVDAFLDGPAEPQAQAPPVLPTHVRTLTPRATLRSAQARADRERRVWNAVKGGHDAA